jgi:hypothetical protein
VVWVLCFTVGIKKEGKDSLRKETQTFWSPNNVLILKVVRLGLCTIDIYIINDYLCEYCMSWPHGCFHMNV